MSSDGNAYSVISREISVIIVSCVFYQEIAFN